MKAGMQIKRRAATAVMFLAAAATLGFMLACVDAKSDWTTTAKPGIYGVQTWRAGDVDGEVGHPLYLGNPTMHCLPARQWTGNVRVVSGQLPPGITIDDRNMGISGIPTERGHWIVRVELYDINCNGETYQVFDHLRFTDIRFHIGGSGRVVQ